MFTVNNVSVLTSRALVDHLCEMQDSPWSTFDLTPSKLAHRLRPYGVRPEQIRADDNKQLRGYTLEGFTDTFDRYLPPADVSQGVNPSQPQVTPETPTNGVTPQTVTLKQAVTHLTSTCGGVTVGDIPAGVES